MDDKSLGSLVGTMFGLIVGASVCGVIWLWPHSEQVAPAPTISATSQPAGGVTIPNPFARDYAIYVVVNRWEYVQITFMDFDISGRLSNVLVEGKDGVKSLIHCDGITVETPGNPTSSVSSSGKQAAWKLWCDRFNEIRSQATSQPKTPK